MKEDVINKVESNFDRAWVSMSKANSVVSRMLREAAETVGDIELEEDEASSSYTINGCRILGIFHYYCELDKEVVWEAILKNPSAERVMRLTFGTFDLFDKFAILSFIKWVSVTRK